MADTKRDEALEKMTRALNVSNSALQAAMSYQQTMQTAHAEGWSDDDPRWDEAWANADEHLEAAQARL